MKLQDPSFAARLALTSLVVPTLLAFVSLRLSKPMFWVLGFPFLSMANRLWSQAHGMGPALLDLVLLVLNAYAWGHAVAWIIRRVGASRKPPILQGSDPPEN